MPLTELEILALRIGYDEAFRPGWEDSLSSILAASPSFFIRLLSTLAWLTGTPRVLPLANERLDMLRLLASALRRGDHRVGELMDRLLALGISRTALDAAIDQVTLAVRGGATSLRAEVRIRGTTGDPSTSAQDALVECTSVDF
ncbi:hypothetical protein [Sphingomonas morindae]|uniref:Uncharacterized protein n=1 Tax=Sphingomonas morindae TaxID=1541170 RepID=A0ABY4XE26_9SPHN|nr:hypothetical protein [Sphingomonas morindae]USI75180.1 hypothetical protein LHA26_19270 [Sphingomonas morindae]